MSDAIDESLDIPDSGSYTITVTKREAPYGEIHLMFSKMLPEELSMKEIKEAVPNFDIGESVDVEINVDEMSFEIQN